MFTFNPDAYVFKASLLQHGFGDVSVLDELEETEELGAVRDYRRRKTRCKQSRV